MGYGRGEGHMRTCMCMRMCMCMYICARHVAQHVRV